MDVLYYWKDIDSDLKAGRVGWLRSTQERLAEFEAAWPDRIWVFKTPRGRRGELQLLARLAWANKPVATAPAVKAGEALLHYDPGHPSSVRFVGTETDEAITQVTAWMRRNFPVAVRGNFQGVNGQQALRNPVLHELMVIAKAFEVRPFAAMPVVAEGG